MIGVEKRGYMNKLKKIPKFKNEDEERDFWASHDVTDYFDMSKAIRNPKFPNLELSTETISLRLPWRTLDEIKMMASRRDVPYQSFIKVILHERIEKERARNEKLRN